MGLQITPTSNRNKTRYLIILLLFSPYLLHAQLVDSLQVSIGTLGTIASKDYQPLWLVSKRFGSVSDQKSDFTTHLAIHNKHQIRLSPAVEQKNKSIYINYGLTAYNNKYLQNTFIQEGYVKAGYKNWQIRAGRFKEIVGEVDKDLSTGSLGVSGNALPIPKVGVAVTDYTAVPFSGGWVQFKGLFSHGWMGQNRYLKDAYLHEKTFYMRLGKNKLKLFGGVQHFAVWGGGREDWLQLDRDWSGFLDVLLIKEADDGSLLNGTVRDGTVPDGTYIMRPNRPGDHRGVVDGGLEWEAKNLVLKAYHQTPFDMGIGITFKNIDKLAGISLANKNPNGVFRKVLVEFVHTKQMTDWVPHHTESYYNNGIYKTGWEYEDRIIGTPLFTNRIRASHYFPEIAPYDWNAPHVSIEGNNNIVNNRILGGHFGFVLSPVSKITTRSILTFVRNYGSFDKNGPFAPHKDQWYSLQEVAYHSPIEGLKITGSAAMDTGELTKNMGFMLGVEWQLSPLPK